MANTYNNGHFTCDTVTLTHALVSNTSVVIGKIRWVSATSAGHQIRITDMNWNPLWTSVASGAQYVEESNFPEGQFAPKVCTLYGLRIASLTSGTVEIYER